jgi:hypothetical protein
MEDRLTLLLGGFASGLALMLLGLKRIVAPQLPLWLSLAFDVLAVGLVGFVGHNLVSADLGIISAAFIATALLASQPAFLGRALRAAAYVTRSVPRGAMQAACGLALTIGAAAWHETALEAAMEDDSALLDAYAQATMRPAAEARTDSGLPIQGYAPVELDEDATGAASSPSAGLFVDRVIRISADNGNCNCHGWVFTGGRYWLTEKSVDIILAENGYAAISDPRDGDLIIYREGKTITHTAMVAAVIPGIGVYAIGKWGPRAVFLHQVDLSGYGQQFTYYRSSRNGHVLSGLDQVPE